MAKTPDTIERSKRLVEDRLAKGWQQKDLIAATGVDRSTVSKHENGTAIPWDKAALYAKAIGTDPHRYAEVVTPSLLAMVEGLERNVKTLAIQVLAAGTGGPLSGVSPPTPAQSEALRGWLNEESRPRRGTA